MPKKVVSLDEHRPHFVISTGKRQHVVSAMFLSDVAAGKQDLNDLAHADEILRAMVRDWIIYTKLFTGDTSDEYP